MAAKYSDRIYLGTGPDGKPIRKRITGNTKAELEANRRKVLAEYGSVRSPSDITLGKYAEKWFSSNKSVRSANTQAMYLYAIKKLAPISSLKLKDVTRVDLQEVINSYWDEPSACQKLTMTIKAIFRAAAVDGIINYNPALTLERPKVIKKPRRILSSQEVFAIRSALDDPMERLYIDVLYCFGLRPGEAWALMPSDFDLKKKRLTVSRAVAFDVNVPVIKGTKTDNVRRLPIPDMLIPELKDYFAALPGLYLFHLRNGQLLTKSAATKLWARIIKKANAALGGNEHICVTEGITQYTFRRTFATDLYYSGISMKKAAQLMGHTDTKMIMEVYAQLDDEREDLSALNDRFDLQCGHEMGTATGTS